MSAPGQAPRIWDLAVVGGGWAGVAAAMHAAGHGWSVVLLEQGGKLGGRATSFGGPPGHRAVDNGQHLFLGAYTETLAMLRQLGTDGAIRFEAPLSIPTLMADGRLETLRAAGLPGPLGLALGLLRYAPLKTRDKAALLWLGLRGAPRLLPALLGIGTGSGLSVGRWLDACGQTQALRDLLWDPMVLAALNARPGEARLSEFMAVLGQGFLRGGRTGSLGRSNLPLLELLAPFQGWLEERGGSLRLGQPVRSLLGQDAGRRGWLLELANQEAVEARRVVLALPAAAAVSLLGPGLGPRLGLEAQAARPRSAIVSVYVWSQEPILPAPLLAFGPQGPGIQARFHWGFSEASGRGWRSCFVASAAGGLAQLDNPALLSALAGFLAGRGRPHQWELARVVREKAATPLFVPAGPPRLGQRTHAQGLALAGDWTDTGLPATIEGAVRSGRQAVQALAAAPAPKPQLQVVYAPPPY
ncbi:MAG TPA: hydroxysqualene dehydroxylase HpnE [bacterium]|jgi:squalene-associated FAD-dependent desaturase|nr:hydroxysqualene dehydroxylase HpnE [bacterium]